jgi:hypothetical protein
LSFIGSPSGCAGGEVRLSFGRNHDGPIVFMAEAVVTPCIQTQGGAKNRDRTLASLYDIIPAAPDKPVIP